MDNGTTGDIIKKYYNFKNYIWIIFASGFYHINGKYIIYIYLCLFLKYSGIYLV